MGDNMLRLLRALLRACLPVGALPAVVLACLLPGMAAASEGPAIIARVDGQIVTTADVEGYMRFLQPAPGETAGALRLRAREQLLAALVARARLNGAASQPDDMLLQKLKEAQRRVMLDHYISQHLAPYTPTDAEIRQFADENPHLFAQRATYRYVEVTLRNLTPPQEDILRVALADLPQGPLTAAQVAALVAQLRAARLPVSAITATRNSEHLPAPFAEALDHLWQSPQHFTMMPTAMDQRLVVILDRQPDPLTVEDMHDQIVQRLISRNTAAQRAQIISALAQDALTGSTLMLPPPDAKAASATANVAQPAFSSVWGLLGLIAAMALMAGVAIGIAQSWLHAARDRYERADDSALQNASVRLVVGLPMVGVPLVCLVAFTFFAQDAIALHKSVYTVIGCTISGVLAGRGLRQLMSRRFVQLGPLIVAALVVVQLAIIVSRF